MEVTTLCYLEKDDAYLMLHRVKKEKDINKDKWIGVGGHVEEGESPEDCLLREVREETGLTLTGFRFRGIVTFLYQGITEYMLLYTADGFCGEITDCDEGVLEWVPKEKVYALPLWEGDLIFFRLLEEEHPFFSLKLRYEGSRLAEAVLDGAPLELLDVVDENGQPTGLTRERVLAHRYGTPHRTSHVWILREGKKEPELLLQKRSHNKDSYPDCYDISSAGHIPAGEDFLPSALRELEEELGLTAAPEDLIPIGLHRGYDENVFYGRPFLNREISMVYLYRKPVDASALILQKEEVQAVAWTPLSECIARAEQGDPLYPLYADELAMIRDHLRKNP